VSNVDELEASVERFTAKAVLRTRVRRTLLTASVAVALVLAWDIVSAAGALVGWFAPWFWTPGALSLAAGVVALAALAGGLAPVREAVVVRDADRRLGLDAALMTSREVAGSTDPICRLLIRRTASALGRFRARQAVPLRMPPATLLLPALGALALALAPPVMTAAFELSRELQELASTLLATPGPDGERREEQMGEILRIESALRAGNLTPEEARAELARLGASLARSDSPQDAEAVLPAGPAPSAAASAATVTGTGEAGQGAGAGSGTARLESDGPDRMTADVTDARAIWTLPAPSGLGGAEAAPGTARGDLSTTSAASVHGRGVDLYRSQRRLTAAERTVVEAYFRALRLRDEEVDRGENRQRSRDSNAGGPS